MNETFYIASHAPIVRRKFLKHKALLKLDERTSELELNWPRKTRKSENTKQILERMQILPALHLKHQDFIWTQTVEPQRYTRQVVSKVACIHRPCFLYPFVIFGARNNR